MKVALSDAVADPVKTHVNCLRALLLDDVIGNAEGGAVVRDHGSGRLGMTEFLQADSDRAGFFAVVEKSSEFGFGGAGQDFAHDLAQDIDGSIGGRRGIIR